MARSNAAEEKEAIRLEWSNISLTIRGLRTWHTVRGGLNRIVTVHLSDGLKTLCGRKRGRMYGSNKYSFDPIDDCQRCRKAALKLAKLQPAAPPAAERPSHD